MHYVLLVFVNDCITILYYILYFTISWLHNENFLSYDLFSVLILGVASLDCVFATAYLGQLYLETRFLISMGFSLLNKG